MYNIFHDLFNCWSDGIFETVSGITHTYTTYIGDPPTPTYIGDYPPSPQVGDFPDKSNKGCYTKTHTTTGTWLDYLNHFPEAILVPSNMNITAVIHNGKNVLPEIKDVIFNPPATVVLWEDGTKTVVKCQPNDTYSKETGLAMAICKKAYGGKGAYNDVFGKWLTK